MVCATRENGARRAALIGKTTRSQRGISCRSARDRVVFRGEKRDSHRENDQLPYCVSCKALYFSPRRAAVFRVKISGLPRKNLNHSIYRESEWPRRRVQRKAPKRVAPGRPPRRAARRKAPERLAPRER